MTSHMILSSASIEDNKSEQNGFIWTIKKRLKCAYCYMKCTYYENLLLQNQWMRQTSKNIWNNCFECVREYKSKTVCMSMPSILVLRFLMARHDKSNSYSKIIFYLQPNYICEYSLARLIS